MKMNVSVEFFNSSIYIIDGLKDEDLNTAKRLFEDIEGYKNYSSTPIVSYHEVTSREEFFELLRKITDDCRAGALPILHFEFHGHDKNGIYIGNSEENISWALLVKELREINIITRNNTGVVMAGCFGFYAILEAGALKPTPFYFLIGSQDRLSAGEIDDNMGRFYKKLFEGDSLSEAMKMVSPKFQQFLAEQEFVKAIIQYFRNQCMGKGKAERVERVVTEWVRRNPSHNRNEFKRFRSEIKRFLKPSATEFHRLAKVFLHDRYSVKAQDVLSFISRFR